MGLVAAISAIAQVAELGRASAQSAMSTGEGTGVVGEGGNSDVSSTSGSAKSTYSFDLPAARGEAQPGLSLTYTGNRWDGDAGVGWDLTVPSIETALDPYSTNPPTNAFGRFTWSGRPLVRMCSGSACAAEPEFTASGAQAIYRLQADTTEAKVYWLGGLTFRVYYKSGLVEGYGESSASRVTGVSAHLTSRVDRNGNRVDYVWSKKPVAAPADTAPSRVNDVPYLTHVFYTQPPGTGAGAHANYEYHVAIAWEPGRAPQAVGSPPRVAPHLERISKIVVGSKPASGAGARERVRTYHFTYKSAEQNLEQPSDLATPILGRSFLHQIVLEGKCEASAYEPAVPGDDQPIDATQVVSGCPTHAPTTYTYSTPAVRPIYHPIVASPSGPEMFPSWGGRVGSLDVDRDGLPDFVDGTSAVVLNKRDGAGRKFVSACSVTALRLPGSPPPGPYDAMLGLYLNQYAAMDVVGQWGHVDQGNSVLWAAPSRPTDGWWGAKYTRALQGCIPQAGDPEPRDAWELTPNGSSPALPLDNFTVAVGDVNGDGLLDQVSRPIGGNHTTIRFSRRSLVWPGPNSQHIRPFSSGVPGPQLDTTPEAIPAMRALVDMNGDGYADAVSTDRLTSGTVKSYYANYDGSPRGLPMFVGQTRFKYGSTSPGSGYVGPNTSRNPYDHPLPSNSQYLFGASLVNMGLVEIRTLEELTGQPTNIEGYIYNDEADPLRKFHFGDINGDGLTDVLLPHRRVGGSRGIAVAVYINVDGKVLRRWCPGFTTGAECTAATDPVLGELSTSQYNSRDGRFMVVDIDGSGAADLVYVLRNEISALALLERAEPLPGLLTRVDNGLGASTLFSYVSYQEHSEDLRAQRGATVVEEADKLEVPMHVVESVTVSNGLSGSAGHTATTHYRYRRPAYDTWARAFRGFGEVTTILPMGESIRNVYAFGKCDSRGGCPETSDSDVMAVNSGLLLTSTTFGEDPDATTGTVKRVLSQTVHRYLARPLPSGEPERTVNQVYQSSITTRLLDGPAKPHVVSQPVLTFYGDSGTPPIVQQTVIWESDRQKILYREQVENADGNVVLVKDFGQIKSESPFQPLDPLVETRTTWVRKGSFIWRPEQVSVAGEESPDVRTTTTTYDARGNATRVDGLLFGTVLLTRAHESPTAGIALSPMGASGAGTVQMATMQYDDVGNLTESWGPVVPTPRGMATASYTKTIYDDTFKHHTRESITGLDGATSQADRMLHTYFLFDRGFGLATEVLSPNNERSRIALDGFGRKVAVYDPSAVLSGLVNSQPRASSSFDERSGLSRVHTWSRDPAHLEALGRETVDYIDGLGVTRLTITQGDTEGSWVAGGAAVRNARGQVVSSAARPSVYYGDLENPDLEPDATVTPIAVTYDEYGRRTGTWEGPPTGSFVGTTRLSMTAYAPLFVQSFDANAVAPGSATWNSRVEHTLDGHGRLKLQSWKMNAESADVRYDYLPSGEAIRETRTARYVGSSQPIFVRERSFDSLGRLVATRDPNTTANGRQNVYAYNAAGWLVGTSDSRGCGRNIAYDAAGRELYQDYSPCTNEQEAYSPPAPWGPNFGDGTESYTVYDAPDGAESPAEYGVASALLGRPVAAYSRGSHTRIKYDVAGRSIGMSRRIAKPGPVSPTLAQRYAPHVYSKAAVFDMNGRTVSGTTGADVAALKPGGVSEYSLQYDARGVIRRVDSSYGLLVSDVITAGDGRVSNVIYGDVAQTRTDLLYDDSRAASPVRRMTIQRNARPTAWDQVGYAPQDPFAPTQQLMLTDTVYNYDANLNPVDLIDYGSEGWAPGAASRTQHLEYDDLDRLTRITSDHGSDPWVSPFKHEGPLSASMPRAVFPTRMQEQTFAYDYLGNIKSSSSDVGAAGRFDRSLGAGTFGTGTAGPNQLKAADGVVIQYDPAGNMVDMLVDRPTGASGSVPTSCEDGRPCKQHFRYSWDEVGNLAIAKRWDLTPGPGVPLDSPSLIAGEPTREMRYTYAGGARVAKGSKPAGGEPRYTLEVFDSLRVEGAKFESGDYELTVETERVSFGGIGRVAYVEQATPDGTVGQPRLFLSLSDHLGSSSFVIDQQTSEVVERTAYDAYGAVESDFRSERFGAYRDPYKFTGKEEDSEVGLVYFGARYYSPQLHRWISPDPLTIHAWGADSNPYAYVGGKVSRMVDPNGLESAPPANDTGMSPDDQDTRKDSGYGPPSHERTDKQDDRHAPPTPPKHARPSYPHTFGRPAPPPPPPAWAFSFGTFLMAIHPGASVSQMPLHTGADGRDHWEGLRTATASTGHQIVEGNAHVRMAATAAGGTGIVAGVGVMLFGPPVAALVENAYLHLATSLARPLIAGTRIAAAINGNPVVSGGVGAGATAAAGATEEIAGTNVGRAAPFNPSGSMTNCVNGVCAFLNSVKNGRLETASADVALNLGRITTANNQIAAQTGVRFGQFQQSTLLTGYARQFYVVYPGSSTTFATHVMIGINNGGKMMLYDPQIGARIFNPKSFGPFVAFPVAF